MKYGDKTTAGSASRSASGRRAGLALAAAILGIGLGSGLAAAQEMYKYRGENGEWIYTDVPPDASEAVEVRSLSKGESQPDVNVFHRPVDGAVEFVASNEFFAPVEVIIVLDDLQNLVFPPAEQTTRWVVPPRSRMQLMVLERVDAGLPGDAAYRYAWLPGDPQSRHAPTEPYRAPFAVSTNFVVSQAFPESMTHVTPDSYHAVDFAMPIGTDIHAARGGIVFDVASTNFRGGTDPERDLIAANLVRILHDDGTFAVYAHLNWNTIRVKPGDQVARGQYIADSGNTGFSSGPHLHFAVIRNRGQGLESVPVVFRGPDGGTISPQAGRPLVAH
jgi:murein DD-endopeptidase MepM/ murein hydrolase activator NlpD